MITRDCEVDINLQTFQWLDDNQALESSHVTIIDPKKGLVRLDEDSLSALRNGSRVVKLLQHSLDRQHKPYNLARIQEVKSSPALQRQHNWSCVDEMFQTLTGLGLPGSRKELLMCGDDSEIFSFIRQVEQHVEGRTTSVFDMHQDNHSGSNSGHPLKSSPPKQRRAGGNYHTAPDYRQHGNQHTPQQQPYSMGRSGASRTSPKLHRHSVSPGRVNNAARSSNYNDDSPTRERFPTSRKYAHVQSKIKSEGFTHRSPSSSPVPRHPQQVPSGQHPLPPVPAHSQRVSALRSHPDVLRDAHPAAQAPSPSSRAKTLPAFGLPGANSVQQQPSPYVLGGQQQQQQMYPQNSAQQAHFLLGGPTSSASHQNAHPQRPQQTQAVQFAQHPSTQQQQHLTSTSLPSVRTSRDANIGAGNQELIDHTNRQAEHKDRIVQQQSAPPGMVRISENVVKPTSKGGKPINLAPFVGKVVLMQTYIRHFWSMRIRHHLHSTLKYAIFTQDRWRYLYRIRPAGLAIANDSERFPLLRGQCERCLPIISVYRQVLIASPNLSQERIHKFIKIACHRCRTLMNSMERWRPNEGEKIRLARERAARLAQAMLRIKISVREKFERAIRAQAFQWSSHDLLFRIVPTFKTLQRRSIKRRWVTIRSKAEMGEFKIGGPAYLIVGSCMRCAPIQLALGERVAYNRTTPVVSKYVKLMCPKCQDETKIRLKAIAALSIRKLVASVHVICFARRVMYKSQRLRTSVVPQLIMTKRRLKRYHLAPALVAQIERVLNGGKTVEIGDNNSTASERWTMCERCSGILEALVVYLLHHGRDAVESDTQSNFYKLPVWCTQCSTSRAVVDLPLTGAGAWESNGQQQQLQESANSSTLITMNSFVANVSSSPSDHVAVRKDGGFVLGTNGKSPAMASPAQVYLMCAKRYRSMNRHFDATLRIFHFAYKTYFVYAGEASIPAPALECQRCRPSKMALFERLFFVKRRTQRSVAISPTALPYEDSNQNPMLISLSHAKQRWKTELPLLQNFYAPRLYETRRFFTEVLCTDCSATCYKQLRHHFTHRNLNFLCRVVVRAVMRIFYVFRKRKRIPQRFTLPRPAGSNPQRPLLVSPNTSCPRCTPIITALHERINGIRTVGSSSPHVSMKLVYRYAELCCQRCQQHTIFRTDKPGIDIVCRILARSQVEFARRVIAYRIINKYLKERIAPEKKAAFFSRSSPSSGQEIDPITLLWYERFPFRKRFDLSKTKCCDRCGPIIDQLECRLHGLFYNGFGKVTFDSIERLKQGLGSCSTNGCYKDRNNSSHPNKYFGTSITCHDVLYQDQRTHFSPAKYFALLCSPCASEVRRLVLEDYIPQIIAGHRSAINFRGKLIRQLLRKRMTPLQADECVRCAPITRALHQRFRGDGRIITEATVHRYLQLLCLKCRQKEPEIAMKKLQNRHGMLVAQCALRGKLLFNLIARTLFERRLLHQSFAAPSSSNESSSGNARIPAIALLHSSCRAQYIAELFCQHRLLKRSNADFTPDSKEASIISMFLRRFATAHKRDVNGSFPHMSFDENHSLLGTLNRSPSEPSTFWRMHQVDSSKETKLIAKFAMILPAAKQTALATVALPFFIRMWHMALFIQTRWRWKYVLYKKLQRRRKRHASLNGGVSYYENQVSSKHFACPCCAPILFDMQRRIMRRSREERQKRFKGLAQAEEKFVSTRYHKVLCDSCAPQIAKWVHLTMVWVVRARRVLLRMQWKAKWSLHCKKIAAGRVALAKLVEGSKRDVCDQCEPVYQALCQRVSSLSSDTSTPDSKYEDPFHKHMLQMCRACQDDVGKRKQDIISEAKRKADAFSEMKAKKKKSNRTQSDERIASPPPVVDGIPVLVEYIMEINHVRSSCKALGEVGSPSDDVIRQLDDETAALAQAKQKLTDYLQQAAASRNVEATLDNPTTSSSVEFSSKQLERSDDGQKIYDFFETLVMETEAASGNAELVAAIIAAVPLNPKTILVEKALATIAAGDGCPQFLRTLLEFGQDTPYDLLEVITIAAYNQTARIPLLQVIIDCEKQGFLVNAMNTSVVDEDLAPVLQEAFEDVCSLVKAQPKEDRTGRLELVMAILGHRRFSRVVSIAEATAGDGRTVLARCCYEGDEKLLLILLHHLKENNAINHVNRQLESDGSTPLVQAVIGDRPNIVTILLNEAPECKATWQVKSENGSAMELAVGLQRDEIVKILEAAGV